MTIGLDMVGVVLAVIALVGWAFTLRADVRYLKRDLSLAFRRIEDLEAQWRDYIGGRRVVFDRPRHRVLSEADDDAHEP